MKRIEKLGAGAAAALALLSLAACDAKPREPRVQVRDTWVRLPAAKGRPGSAYFRVFGNMEGLRLTGITSPLVRRIELHESVEKNGITRMEKTREVEFPSRGALDFAPGGRHAMLMDMSPSVVEGGAIALTFSFNMAPPVTVDAKVLSPSADPHGAH
jgi:copper(I)-binding protein